MDTTAKISCQILVDLLVANGVENVVISPGSRNAPLIIAMARCEKLKKHVVIDERSAAFIALGMANASGSPVALVCTSGTALLNYAPAVAEAYYRRTPLIVISADRPVEWIDQDDSQTIRQYEALANYVKGSYNIPDHIYDETTKWYVNRIINDAIINATSGRQAPVHLNMQFDEPLNVVINKPEQQTRCINIVKAHKLLDNDGLISLAHRISEAMKVMIIAGFNAPDVKLNQALKRLACHKNIVVLTETISNLKDKKYISTIDSVLNIMSEEEKQIAQPDIVITLGGALVSRHIKQYLRATRPTEHWHIGITDTTIDCFQSLTTRIDIEPGDFFSQINGKIVDNYQSEYSLFWADIKSRAERIHKEFVKKAEWSDLKAFDIIFKSIPSKWNLQLSNGTSIRYAQLFNTTKFNRSDCNRGVSGIDGCTSTALGASLVYDDVTLLISGDMSAQYDIGALSSNLISSRFKMIVIDNGGGGIFRFIKSTSHLPELEEYFAAKTNLPVKCIAQGYGFEYFEASNEHQLKKTIKEFISTDNKPAILCVKTPTIESAEILKNYFTQK